jgi:hypothetical protein
MPKNIILEAKIDSLVLSKAVPGRNSSAENANVEVNCRRNNKQHLLGMSIIYHRKIPTFLFSPEASSTYV